MKRLLTLLLALTLLLPSLARAEALSTFFVSLTEEAQTDFFAANPGVTLLPAKPEEYIQTTDELNGKLLTGEFTYDVFALHTLYGDPQAVMKKGFCLDLSGSATIREAIDRLWPGIAAQCMQDGRIYAVPTHIQVEPLMANREVWESLGYTIQDVPQSFPALLDFLDQWVIRMETEPEAVDVYSRWDETVYTKNTYARWLVELLLNEYIYQRQYAGESIRFDDPALAELLNHARQTGQTIACVEPVKSESKNPGLLDDSVFFEMEDLADWGISLRMNDEQPRLLTGLLDMTAVNAGTDQPELAIAFAESVVTHDPFTVEDAAKLYQDAEPIEEPNYQESLQYTLDLISVVKNATENPEKPLGECVVLTDEHMESYQYWYAYLRGDPDMDAVEETLARWEASVSDESDRWAVSPEALASYKQFAPTLFFPASTAFSTRASEAGSSFATLRNRFADGQMDVAQFLSEIDRIAEMVELEAASD